MTDIAQLGYSVDTSGLSQGTRALESFGTANVNASKAAQVVEKTVSTAGATVTNTAGAVNKSAAEIKRLSDAASSAADQFDKANYSASRMNSGTDRMVGSVTRASNRIDGFSASWTLVEQKTDQATKATEEAGEAYDQLGRKTDDAAKALPYYGREVDGARRKTREAADETGNFSSKLSEVRDQAERTRGAFSMLARYASMIGIAMGARQLQVYADTWSDISARVGLAVGGMDLAPPVMARIDEMARRTYSSLNLTAESFIANSTSLRELGLNTTQQLDYTEALNNAMVVSGARAERAASVSNALSKAMALGALRGDELNTVMASGGRVAELLAAHFDTTTNQLRKLGSEGKITSAVIYESLVGSLEKLREEADSMPATIGDAFTIMGNSVMSLVGGFDQAVGASETLSQAIIMLADNLQLLLSVAAATAGFFAIRYVAAIGTAAVTSTYSLIAANVALHKALFGSSTAVALLATATRGLSLAMVALRGAIISTGIGALVVGAGLAINKFLELSKAAGGFGNAIALVGAVVREEWTRILARFESMDLQIQAVGHSMRGVFVDALAHVVETVGRGVNRVIGVFNGGYEAVKAIWNNLAPAVGSAAVAAANTVLDAIEGMVKKAAGLLDGFINSLPEFMGLGESNLAGSISFRRIEDDFESAGESAGEAFTRGFNQEFVNVEGVVGTLREGAETARMHEESARGLARAWDVIANQPNVALEAVKDLLNSTDETTDAVDELTNALNAAGAAADGAGKKGAGAGDKAKKAAEEASKAVKDFQNQIQEGLVRVIDSASKAFGDWVMRGFRDFKSFTKSILDSFRSMLSEMIAMAAKNRIMISMGLDPLSMSLSRAGATGGGGFLAGAVGSFANPSAGGFLGGLGGAWGGISSGFATGGIGGAVSGGLSASVAGISGGLSAGGIAGISAALGAAVPIIAGVAAVFKIGKALFGRRLKDTGIDATFSMAEGIAARTYKFYKGGFLRSNKTTYEDMDKETADPIGAAFMEVGRSVSGFADQLGLNADKIEKLSWRINFSTRGMSEQDIQRRFEEELLKYGDAAANAVAGEDNLQKFRRAGETSFQTMERLATHLTAFNNAAKDLGWTIQEVGLQGADAASKFIELFGSLEAFGNAASYYYQNFYSAAERHDRLREQLTKSFSDMGRRLPRSEADFRRMVEQAEANGNMDRVAELLKLAPAVKEFLDTERQLTEQSLALSEAERERLDLNRRLLQAQGDTQALRDLELKSLDRSNRALLRQIWAAERAAEVAKEREGLERQLLQAQGDTAALRELDLAALDRSNRALQQQIWAAERAAEVANERQGLERQLLQVNGDTAALRRLELESLDASNRALQELIWKREREAEVAEERQDLERRLLEVNGDTAALRALDLAALDKSNRALQEQIWAREKELEIAEERQGLERKLLEINGDTAAIRKMELESLDESNRALQQSIWAREKEIEILDERTKLENTLLELQGDTSTLRRMELERLDASNRALQERIWALQESQAIERERKDLELEYARVIGDTAFIRNSELSKINEVNRALKEHIWALESAQEAVEGAKNAVRSSAAEERQRISSLRSSSEAMRSLANQTVEATRQATEAQRLAAESQLRLALEAGDAISDRVASLAREAANVDANNFSSYVAFATASARAASVINAVADEQERQAKSAEQRLEAALEKYGLRDETVLGLTDALNNLQDALDNLSRLQDPSRVSPVTGQADAPNKQVQAVESVVQSQQVQQAELVKELGDLRKEVARLREENNQGNVQIAKHGQRTAELLRKWEVDGLPEERG